MNWQLAPSEAPLYQPVQWMTKCSAYYLSTNQIPSVALSAKEMTYLSERYGLTGTRGTVAADWEVSES